ncbi:MAG: hypothetical protein QM736_01720, partial [Vicinamibacterales bacterium]
VGSNPVQRVQLFVDRAKVALPTVLDDPQSVVEGLVSRVSYVTFFSRVLEHVPSREPFADGELLKMTFSNAFMPRFLFPDKGALPSDSYYTRRFAGVFVMEDNTSISIGYMAEFYADWGMTGMLISTFCYGLLLGVAVWIIRAQTPRLLTNPALIVTMLSVLPFEHQFIKGFATLILSVVLAVVVTRLVEPLMIRHLHVRRLLTGSGGRARVRRVRTCGRRSARCRTCADRRNREHARARAGSRQHGSLGRRRGCRRQAAPADARAAFWRPRADPLAAGRLAAGADTCRQAALRRPARVRGNVWGGGLGALLAPGAREGS